MTSRRATGCLAIFCLLVVAPAAAAFKHVEVGSKTPELTLSDLSGARVSGVPKPGTKALAVVFWATWSPRSRTVLDDLEKVYRAHRDKGFQVLAVNVDHEHLDDAARREVESLATAWSFPVAVDEGLVAYYQYGVVATPSLALVDREGTVRYVRAGYSTSAREEVPEAIEALLGVVPETTEKVAVRKRDYVPPKKATLHFQKAQVLIRRGMAKKAVPDLDKAAKLDPRWPEPRVLLARIYLKEARKKPGALDKAEVALLEAQAIQPKHLQTLSLLADVSVERGAYEAALGFADEALAVEPAYTPALLARARSLRALGRIDEANASVDRALEYDPRNPEIFIEKGEVAAAQGRWEGAAAAFRKAVELAVAAPDREG